MPGEDLLSWPQISLCDSFTHSLSEHEPKSGGMVTFPNLPKICRDKGEGGHVVSCNHKSLASQSKDISDSTRLWLGW